MEESTTTSIKSSHLIQSNAIAWLIEAPSALYPHKIRTIKFITLLCGPDPSKYKHRSKHGFLSFSDKVVRNNYFKSRAVRNIICDSSQMPKWCFTVVHGLLKTPLSELSFSQIQMQLYIQNTKYQI